MTVPLVERMFLDILLERITPSKQLQSDMHELDSMREDDPKNNMRWLTDAMDRLLQREHMLNARVLQTKRIQSGASLANDNSASSSVALAQDK